MAKAKKIGGLGRGLEALIPQIPDAEDPAAKKAGAEMLPLERISVNPYQPRRVFDEGKMRELTDSIREHGVITPVLARVVADGYQLIAGERRLRAAREAGLGEIPAMVRELTDHEMMEVSLIENIQRQDLDAVEEARAYKRLAEEFDQTQEQIARRVSKSRPYIANSIRLLNLPDAVLEHLAAGRLSVGHVRPLLTLKEEDALRLANRLVEGKATVREAEQWAKEADEFPAAAGTEEKTSAQAGQAHKKPSPPLPAELKEIQRLLREAINTKVEISQGARGGKIIIDYYTDDDIGRILELFTGVREMN